jgi:hypothetical protein
MVVAVGVGFTVMTAAPAFAERTPAEIEQDRYTIVSNRATQEQELAAMPTGRGGDETAVLGEQARPVAGVDISPSVYDDMIQVLHNRAERDRTMGTLPGLR